MLVVEGAIPARDDGVYMELGGRPAIQVVKEVAAQTLLTVIAIAYTYLHSGGSRLVGVDLPGTIVLYRKEDIVRAATGAGEDRSCPCRHYRSALMTAEMLGASPENVLLVGIVGECYEPGCPLTKKLSLRRKSVRPAG